jgi:hypothetical protein
MYLFMLMASGDFPLAIPAAGSQISALMLRFKLVATERPLSVMRSITGHSPFLFCFDLLM